MKSTRSLPVVSALTWLMEFWIHVKPVLFTRRWQGYLRRSDASSNDGQRDRRRYRHVRLACVVRLVEAEDRLVAGAHDAGDLQATPDADCSLPV